MSEFCIQDAHDPVLDGQYGSAIRTAAEFAEDWFHHPSATASGPPVQALRRLQEHGLLRAPMPLAYGGLGLGTRAGSHMPLLRILASLGGADLALGRIYEGHVNALVLIASYGSPEQIEDAVEAAQAGLLFGVWNTGDATPMRIEDERDRLTLRGCKTFATGAGFVQRPVVTAERNGWQMTLPHLEDEQIAASLRIDRDSWQPLGMESSESLTVDFSGVPLRPVDLLGKPGDFYHDPLFRGGAIRFAAVQTGALLRLARMFPAWLKTRGRQADAYQVARAGQVEMLAQEAVLWTERAANTADWALHRNAGEQEKKSMIRIANMHRLAVEKAATALMTHVVTGIGAHGLLRPARFERIARDLTMYLRQPNPDGTLADLGRSALADGTSEYWTGS